MHNSERVLDLATNEGRAAEDKIRGLRSLNGSMFAVHVKNPFNNEERHEILVASGQNIKKDDRRQRLRREETTSLSSNHETSPSPHQGQSSLGTRQGLEGRVAERASPISMSSLAPELDTIDQLLMQWTTLSNDDIVGFKMRGAPLLAMAPKA